jgi:hypothetical protein
MANNSVLLKARGLHTEANQLGAIPEGALYEADNVVIDRDGVIEPRRGFKIYGNSFGTSSSIAKQLLVYKDRLIRHYSTILQFDDGSGTFTNFTGSYDQPATDVRIKSQETNGNFYFTTSSGIKKISETQGSDISASSIIDAGAVKALDVELSLDTNSSWLPSGYTVGYRTLWGIEDNNKNLLLGTPSPATQITNDVLVEGTITVISMASPTQITSATHGLISTDVIVISGSNSTPSIDGTYVVTVVDANNFTIPVNVTVAGTTGEWYKEDSRSVSITITIPEAITTAHFYQVYRTSYTTTESPGEEYKLVYENNPTSGEITAGIVVVDDILPEALNAGANLYTNPNSGEGIGQANEPPPSANDLTLFKNSLFYANTRTRYKKFITLIGTSSLVAGTSYLKISDEVTDDNRYYFNTTEKVASGTITANSVASPTVITSVAHGLSAATPYVVKITGSNSTPSIDGYYPATVIGVDTFSVPVNVTIAGTTGTWTVNQVELFTSGSPSQDIDDTARSIVRVINKQSSEVLYAFYLSGPDDLPGAILFEGRSLDEGAFYFTVNNTATGTQFNPVLPTSGDTVIADNEVSPNRVYYSKFQQPEAVPLLNYFDVGPRDKAIKRILALRDSVFVLKEEAIYRISGEFGSFVVTLLDNSTLITAPDTAVVLNNQIYSLTDQGVASISDTGVQIISQDIENLLLVLNLPTFTNYKSASFGVSYEADRSYYLWTVEQQDDTTATQCFRFNVFTNSWTRWPINKTCGIINSADKKMYLGAGDVNYIEQERKTFTRLDYSDRELETTIQTDFLSENVLTLAPAVIEQIDERDVLVQEQYLTSYQFNKLLRKLDSDTGVNDSDYEELLTSTVGSNIRESLTSLATKLDADTGVTDTDYSTSIVAYTDSFSDCQLAFNVLTAKLNLDATVTYVNYPTSTGTVVYEVIVSSIDLNGNTLTYDYTYPFIQGLITFHKRIESSVIWAPQFFGDPSMIKHMSESTIIFERNNFSKATISYSSDLFPGFTSIEFTSTGNGTFGNSVFGNGQFGGLGNQVPFRTYIPRNNQRCRYLNCKFEHSTARESYALYGLSITGSAISNRGYK